MQVTQLDQETLHVLQGDKQKEIYLGQKILDFKCCNEVILFRNTDQALFLNCNAIVKKLESNVKVYDVSAKRLCYQHENCIVFLEFDQDLKFIRKVPIFVPFEEPILCLDATFGYFCFRRRDAFVCFFGDFYRRSEVVGEFERYGFTREGFWAERADKTRVQVLKYK